MSATSASFYNLVARSPKWGSDLMGHFVAGVNMQFPALLSTLSRIRAAIENSLSFYIVANDRMAARWGSDFVQHFGAGMQQAAPAMMFPIPAPVAVGGGGSSASATYNTPVNIEINITGSQAQGLDERKLAAMVRDEIGQALRSRGR